MYMCLASVVDIRTRCILMQIQMATQKRLYVDDGYSDKHHILDQNMAL